jgi:hypothetical protein
MDTIEDLKIRAASLGDGKVNAPRESGAHFAIGIRGLRLPALI